MKKTLLLLLMAVAVACSTENSATSSTESSFKIFKSTSGAMGKVMEDTHDGYKYTAYGYFRPTSSASFFVPKNIRIIEQLNLTTGKRIIIKLNDNLLPQTFYQFNSPGTATEEYHVFYNDDKTVIKKDTKNPDGLYITVSEYDFPALGAGRFGRNARNSEGDCEDPFNEQSEIHPCSNNSIYLQVADWWDNYTNNTIISSVGDGVSWIIKTATEKICSGNSRSADSITCDDYDDDSDPQDLCQVLLTCDNDCNGVAFGNAYPDDCGTCVGGTTENYPCNITNAPKWYVGTYTLTGQPGLSLPLDGQSGQMYIYVVPISDTPGAFEYVAYCKSILPEFPNMYYKNSVVPASSNDFIVMEYYRVLQNPAAEWQREFSIYPLIVNDQVSIISDESAANQGRVKVWHYSPAPAYEYQYETSANLTYVGTTTPAGISEQNMANINMLLESDTMYSAED